MFVFCITIGYGVDEIKLFKEEEDAYKHIFNFKYKFLYETLIEEREFRMKHENCINCELCWGEYENCVEEKIGDEICKSVECYRCSWNRSLNEAIKHLNFISSSNNSWKEKYISLSKPPQSSDFGNLGSFSIAIINTSFSDVEKLEVF